MLELAILSFTKVRIFLIPLSIAFSNPQNCRFPFSVKKKLHPRSEIQKIKLQKSETESLITKGKNPLGSTFSSLVEGLIVAW